jgi:hypothetical protein
MEEIGMLKRLIVNIFSNSENKWLFTSLFIFWLLLQVGQFVTFESVRLSFGGLGMIISALLFLFTLLNFIIIPMLAYLLHEEAIQSLSVPWRPVEGIISVALFPFFVVCWQMSFVLGNIDNLLAYWSVVFEFRWLFVFFPVVSYLFISRDDMPSLISWVNGNLFFCFLLHLLPKSGSNPEGFECNGEFLNSGFDFCNGTEIPISDYITWVQFLSEFYGITIREHDLVNYLQLSFFVTLTCVTLIALRAVGLRLKGLVLL